MFVFFKSILFGLLLRLARVTSAFLWFRSVFLLRKHLAYYSDSSAPSPGNFVGRTVLHLPTLFSQEFQIS